MSAVPKHVFLDPLGDAECSSCGEYPLNARDDYDAFSAGCHYSGNERCEDCGACSCDGAC